jgi:hypothetical protein
MQNVRDMVRQCLDIQSRIKAAILTFAGTDGRTSTIDERIKKIEYIINQMDELTEHLPELCECGDPPICHLKKKTDSANGKITSA